MVLYQERGVQRRLIAGGLDRSQVQKRKGFSRGVEKIQENRAGGVKGEEGQQRTQREKTYVGGTGKKSLGEICAGGGGGNRHRLLGQNLRQSTFKNFGKENC